MALREGKNHRYHDDKIQPEAVWPGVLEADSQWCYPQKNSYRNVLRSLITDYGAVKKKAKKLQKYVLKNWAPEIIHKQFVDAMGVDLTVTEEVSSSEDVVVFD